MGTVSRGPKGRVDAAEAKRYFRNNTDRPHLRTPLEQSRICRIRKIRKKSQPGTERKDFHDLRRTSPSLLAEAGRPALEIAAFTGCMSLKNLETHMSGGPAGTGERRHRGAGKPPAGNIGNWTGNPLGTFVYCRLKQKLTWGSMLCCGTPLSEVRMVRRQLRKKRRRFQQRCLNLYRLKYGALIDRFSPHFKARPGTPPWPIVRSPA